MKKTITTHDIKAGDIILNYGMVLLVDSEPEVSKVHPDTHPGGECKYVAARVLNYADLKAQAADGDGTAIYLLKFIDSDMSPNGHRAANGLAPYTEPRWSIQGNGLATWTLKTDDEEK